jgi:nitroimidazol reductase NimA-like FMN-containing flavoprotein (pyridoxamine 5'-phosphate oxidase superfamily)
VSEPGDPLPEPLQAPLGYGFPTNTLQLLPWSFAEERLQAARNYWLATVRPSGSPHVTPLWGVWVDRCLYVDGLPAARWARNIARNPAASVNLEDGAIVVIVEGLVEDVIPDAETSRRILAAWDAKYGRLHPEPMTRGMFRLRPTTARGWSVDTLGDGTRWRFA